MGIKDNFSRPQNKLVNGGVLESYHRPLFMKLAKSVGFYGEFKNFTAKIVIQ